MPQSEIRNYKVCRGTIVSDIFMIEHRIFVILDFFSFSYILSVDVHLPDK
jgi:hypothetical protein